MRSAFRSCPRAPGRLRQARPRRGQLFDRQRGGGRRPKALRDRDRRRRAGSVVVQVDLDSSDADEATLERVAAAARDACADAYDDLSGSADYRRAMAGVYARRAFELALEARDGQNRR